MRTREIKISRRSVHEKGHLEIHGRLRKGMGVETCLHSPMEAAKRLKLKLRVGDLDLPERKRGCTSS